MTQSKSNKIEEDNISGENKFSVSIKDLYNEISNSELGITKERLEAPLVSIIITSHNTEKFIEASINSLLLQTYKNLEVIVVDDYSTDKTFQIASRIANSTSKVKTFRLNSNLGTYFAKNTGILKSKGDIIFFQDSDDVCHHERIERCVNALLSNKDNIAVRCAYSRINLETQNIIKVNDNKYKLGLITLGVYRKVFNEIGFFNCTTKASDDEFYHRMIKYYGKNRINNLFLPLYYNTMREDSLFSDMVEWVDENNIKQKTSDARQNYLHEFQKIHNERKLNELKEIFSFPRIHDALPISKEMSKLSNPKIPVYINICSIPSRIKQLQYTIGVLKNQCDHFHIYLDGYPEVPDFIKKLGNKATVINCQNKNESIRDNGKFILLEKLIKENKDGYYITCDDDIRYPADYINTMIKKINKYNDKAAIGLHGVIFPSRVNKYFSSDRIVYNFQKPLENDTAVNILGTGTVAFRVSIFNKFSLSDFEHPGMVDIYFSILCKKNNILQVCISRPSNWLTEDNKNTETLFHEFQNNDEIQSKLIISNNPWGYSSIYPLLNNNANYSELIPCLSFYNE
ncbi:TPA: glycosyltransferase family 2 protein [Pasteurella multocida]|nr:glycosyltransferase family 2 protein [Pasteurella multocida]